METDADKIDDAVLALLWLTLHDERLAWKGFDWETSDRLPRKGLIGDPVDKSKSLVLTDEGPAPIGGTASEVVYAAPVLPTP